jgi:hypothetical protein
MEPADLILTCGCRKWNKDGVVGVQGQPRTQLGHQDNASAASKSAGRKIASRSSLPTSQNGLQKLHGINSADGHIPHSICKSKGFLAGGDDDFNILGQISKA